MLTWPKDEAKLSQNSNLLADIQILRIHLLILDRKTTWNKTITIADNKIGAQELFRTFFRNQLSCLGAEKRRFVIGVLA